MQCSVADRCLTAVEEWCGDCCHAFVLQEAKRAGHTVHVAKLTHRLAMHFAERLKRPQEGVNLLKVSHPVHSSTRQSKMPYPQRAEWLEESVCWAVGAYTLHVLGCGA